MQKWLLVINLGSIGSQKLGRGLRFWTASGMFESASADRSTKSYVGSLLTHSLKDHVSTILLDPLVLHEHECSGLHFAEEVMYS